MAASSAHQATLPPGYPEKEGDGQKLNNYGEENNSAQGKIRQD
jgi:hypothetical protein